MIKYVYNAKYSDYKYYSNSHITGGALVLTVPSIAKTQHYINHIIGFSDKETFLTVTTSSGAFTFKINVCGSFHFELQGDYIAGFEDSITVTLEDSTTNASLNINTISLLQGYC